MKRIFLINLIIVIVLLSACGSAQNGRIAIPTATAPATPRPTRETRVARTETPYPTYTPQPTSTPRPTDIPPPTATAIEPTAAVGPIATTSPTAPPTITAVPENGTASTRPTAQASAGQVVKLTRIEDTDPGPPITIQVSAVRIKANRYYQVTGIVRNDGAEIYGGVGVIATFFTDAKPPNHHGPVEVYAACLLLAPGEACPFCLEIYPRDYTAYHLHPKGAPVEYHQPASLALSGLSIYNDRFGYVHITGTATNGNPFAVRDAYIWGTLIDAEGQIASVGMTLAPGEIVPGASVAFNVRIERVPYVRYEVQAQATRN